MVTSRGRPGHDRRGSVRTPGFRRCCRRESSPAPRRQQPATISAFVARAPSGAGVVLTVGELVEPRRVTRGRGHSSPVSVEPRGGAAGRPRRRRRPPARPRSGPRPGVLRYQPEAPAWIAPHKTSSSPNVVGAGASSGWSRPRSSRARRCRRGRHLDVHQVPRPGGAPGAPLPLAGHRHSRRRPRARPQARGFAPARPDDRLVVDDGGSDHRFLALPLEARSAPASHACRPGGNSPPSAIAAPASRSARNEVALLDADSATTDRWSRPGG